MPMKANYSWHYCSHLVFPLQDIICMREVQSDAAMTSEAMTAIESSSG